MILRRFMKHITDQNWFAVGLDVLVVITGIFLGMQVQQFVEEQARKASEHFYLERLHDEVEQLMQARSVYDDTRRSFSIALREILKILNDSEDVTQFSPSQCQIIAHSSFTTVPPAGLPTAMEMLSAGRLDQVSSPEIRNNILAFVQDEERARDLILAISDTNKDLGMEYPGLLTVRMENGTAILGDTVGLNATCDAEALRKSPALMNDINSNAYGYIIYAERGVLRVSDQLVALHKVLDIELGIQHADLEEETP